MCNADCSLGRGQRGKHAEGQAARVHRLRGARAVWPPHELTRPPVNCARRGPGHPRLGHPTQSPHANPAPLVGLDAARGGQIFKKQRTTNYPPPLPNWKAPRLVVMVLLLLAVFVDEYRGSR